MKLRSVAAAAIVGGFIAVGAATSFAAAPLSEVSANNQGASATALGVPGTLTVSDSAADADSASWSLLTVAGTSLIGREPSGSLSGKWVGTLGALGGLADTVSAALCPDAGGPLVSVGIATCVELLPSAAEKFGDDDAYAQGSLAHITALYYDGTDLRGTDLAVLPSTSVRANGCYSEGHAAIVSGALVTPALTPIVLGEQSKTYSTCGLP